jgi:hypothetical protein
MIVKTPSRVYQLGEHLPPVGMPVVSWPWGLTPSLQAWAEAQLHFPLGTVILDTVDGHPVIAQIQTHTGYGAHPEIPPTPHKGTSVFVPAVMSGNAMVAVKDPPAGWGDSATIGADGFSVEAIRELAQHEEAQALTMVKKIPPGAMTAGGAGIGLLIGGPPGALVGGLVGGVMDLWSHLTSEPPASPPPAAPQTPSASGTPQRSAPHAATPPKK